MTTSDNKMRLAEFDFSIEEASFCFVANGYEGPGWDFRFYGDCLNDDQDDPKFPFGILLRTEGAPLLLQKWWQ